MLNTPVMADRSFPWLDANLAGSKRGYKRRAEVIADELRARAAILYRLGFSPSAATDRLEAELCWEFDPESTRGGPHCRPQGLAKADIAKLVQGVFDRRPS